MTIFMDFHYRIDFHSLFWMTRKKKKNKNNVWILILNIIYVYIYFSFYILYIFYIFYTFLYILYIFIILGLFESFLFEIKIGIKYKNENRILFPVISGQYIIITEFFSLIIPLTDIPYLLLTIVGLHWLSNIIDFYIIFEWWME